MNQWALFSAVVKHQNEDVKLILSSSEMDINGPLCFSRRDLVEFGARVQTWPGVEPEIKTNWLMLAIQQRNFEAAVMFSQAGCVLLDVVLQQICENPAFACPTVECFMDMLVRIAADCKCDELSNLLAGWRQQRTAEERKVEQSNEKLFGGEMRTSEVEKDFASE